MRFDFKLISAEELEGLVKKVFDLSGIKYENEGVSLIAKLGEGSARDTLSIADMCVAFTNKNVTYSSVVEAVGTTDINTLKTLAEYLLNKKVDGLLSEINKVANSGKNLAQLAKDLAGYFRDIAVVKTCKNYEEILKYPKQDLVELEAFAKHEIYDILNILKTLGSLEQDFRYTQNPRALFEIVMLSMVFPQQELSEDTAPTAKETIDVKMIEKTEQTAPLNEKEVFGKLLVNLRESREFKLYVMLEKVNEYYIKDGKFRVKITSKSTFDDLTKPKNIECLDNVLDGIISGLKVEFVLVEETKKEVDVAKMLEQDFGKMLKIKEG